MPTVDHKLPLAVAGSATQGSADPVRLAQNMSDSQLESLLERVRSQIRTEAVPAEGHAPSCPQPSSNAIVNQRPPEFLPIEPTTLRQAGLNEGFVESLLLKFLLAAGDATGRDTADQVKLSFLVVESLLRQMKTDQLVVYRAAAQMGDYVYQLTDLGRDRARRHLEHCTYFGSAPVRLDEYVKSVAAQSLRYQSPKPADLDRAFEDLLLNKAILRQLGPAITSGRGLFLYGAPGNGKSSIAERLTRAFGQFIWIPRALVIDGEVMRLYDPANHEAAPAERPSGLLDHQNIDRRWVRIRRPTIIVGGELTMSALEVTLSEATGISEAPLQMKSNCGTLVIDDFGRQRMSTDELLNRWIIPLEKRYDFLNMPNGKKFQVPFDQLIVFSTNLEPRDLVDEAFLRRIPYKIDVSDPTEAEFRSLFKLMAPQLGFQYRDDVVTDLIDRHYRPTKRPFRCCQPRDLLQQVRNLCLYLDLPLEMRPDHFDLAVENYFAVM